MGSELDQRSTRRGLASGSKQASTAPTDGAGRVSRARDTTEFRAALSRADGAHRAQLVGRLQRAAGNAAVQRLLAHGPSVPAIPVQRGPGDSGAVATKDPISESDYPAHRWQEIGEAYEESAWLAEARGMVSRLPGTDAGLLDESNPELVVRDDDERGDIRPSYWSFRHATAGVVARVRLRAEISELRPEQRKFFGRHHRKLLKVLLFAPVRRRAASAATAERSEPTTGEKLKAAAIVGADIGTDFAPIVSNLKDAYTALTGINPVTGEKVGTLGRVLAGVFAIPIVGNVAKYLAKGGRLLYKGGRVGVKTLSPFARRIGEIVGRVTSTAQKRKLVRDTIDKLRELRDKLLRRPGTAADIAPRSPLSQPGGLAASEGRQVRNAAGNLGPPAHALAKHGPDVPLSTIRKRVADGHVGTSTKFTDRAAMEAAIGATMDARKADIAAWLSTHPPAGATRRISHSPGTGSLGAGFRRTPSGNVEAMYDLQNCSVVLKSDGTGGYVIQSAFPF